MIPERLPWHDPQWLRIERSIRSGRVPHALLLRGASGNGKKMFAARLAAVLLCGSKDFPCGECGSCRLCAAGSHPDWTDVKLEPDRREIVVDQIRDLIHSIGLTARFGRYKVVILESAELMNRHAANTLLKTLEEPPGATVFVLVSSNSAQLLPTIRSRCQSIDFPVPDPDIALGVVARQGAGSGFRACGGSRRASPCRRDVERGSHRIARGAGSRSRPSPCGGRPDGRGRALEGARASEGHPLACRHPRRAPASE